MSDWRASQPSPGQQSNSSASQQSTEGLQQALRELSARGGGPITSEVLADLASRAGYTSPTQVAELGRMLGIGAPGAGGNPQYIFFRLANAECAFPPGAVQSVERIAEVTAVPNTAAWVLGVVQVWGAILSAVDLRRYFGLPPQPITARSRLLVVASGDMTIGFVIDAVSEMRPLGPEAVGAVDGRAVPEWALPYAAGLIRLADQTITLLDPDRLLFSEKMRHYQTNA